MTEWTGVEPPRCGAVSRLGGDGSEYLACDLAPEHTGKHIRCVGSGAYLWTDEEAEQPRDPWEREQPDPERDDLARGLELMGAPTLAAERRARLAASGVYGRGGYTAPPGTIRSSEELDRYSAQRSGGIAIPGTLGSSGAARVSYTADGETRELRDVRVEHVTPEADDDNEVTLRNGKVVGRVKGYSYGNGHLSATLDLGGWEYLLALQVQDPADAGIEAERAWARRQYAEELAERLRATAVAIEELVDLPERAPAQLWRQRGKATGVRLALSYVEEELQR